MNLQNRLCLRVSMCCDRRDVPRLHGHRLRDAHIPKLNSRVLYIHLHRNHRCWLSFHLRLSNLPSSIHNVHR